ncbi:MAG: beta-galactosidase [Armatimonadetes bacterium]|nr:beta-galactosidase [Armatimonadota bacterium]
MSACLTLIIAYFCAGSPQSLLNWEDPSGWSPNPDGGHAPAFAADSGRPREGKPSLRLTYTDQSPHWGNLSHSVQIPPQATALEFQLYKAAARPEAAMHLWLFEADGDGWVQEIRAEGKPLGQMPTGWQGVRLPMAGFRFDPRGNRKRELLTADRLLVGCNYAGLEINLAAGRFILKEETAVSIPPRTENLSVNRTDRGSIAMLNDALPASAGASSPTGLTALLEEAGYGVTPLRAADLCDPAVLTRSNFDLLLLPYGPAYPADGREALVAYLKAGGAFLSLGGYAFDRLLRFENGEWTDAPAGSTASQMDSEKETVFLNTRFGRPGDALGLQPEQIGAFDPSFELKQAVRLAAAPGQSIAPESLNIRGSFEGFAASGLTGSNSPVFPDIWARRIPLVNAYDAYGRLRGSAGALMHHYAGPYARSSWAFFGVTNQDLFGPAALPEMERLLFRTVDALLARTFLHRLETDLACYRQGEEVKITVKASNFGPSGREGGVSIKVISDEKGPIAFRARKKASLAPGETAEFSFTWKPKRFDSDFYRIEAEIGDAQGAADRIETGFVVWNPQTVGAGIPLRLKGNYFRSGATQEFLTGTNQTGMMFYSADENPLVWERDLKAMRDYGLNLLRILHFSPFAAKGYEGQGGHSSLDLKNRPARLVRQTDAVVQLCQKYRIALFLALHDWLPVEISDEELAAQRDWNAFWAERYRDVPGILYDVQNEPSVSLSNIPDLKRLWNDYLKERYRTEDALRAAWKYSPPEKPFGEIDVENGSEAWDDLKTYDANHFKVLTLNRWVKANVEGMKKGSPGHNITVGYLPWMQPADKLLGNRHTDFSDMHYYGSLADFARQFKLTDRRFEGKSFSLGEFGAQEAHDARTQGQTGDRPQQSIERFLLYGHLALGMGASFIESWDWKDFESCVFPWGLLHPGDNVPKDVLKAYRNMALLFRGIHPVNFSPSVCLLVPDSHRLGASWDRVHAAVLNAIDGLLACRVPFDVIGEFDLDRLPKAARTLFWPLPYCPRDETYARVKKFVEQGGSLYLSGDLSYDDLRRRTREDRLRELCGVEPAAESGPMAPLAVRSAGASALEGNAWTNKLGKGKVFFAARPAELEDAPAALYSRFLAFASEKRLEVAPDTPSLQAFSLPADGGQVYILYNHGEAEQTATFRIGKREVLLTVGPRHPALLQTGRKGSLLAAEAQGRVSYDGEILWDGSGHVALCSLDGEDIRKSRSLMLLPFEPSRLSLNTDARWRRPAAEVGEFSGGQWKRLGAASLRLSGDDLHMEIDSLEALNIILIGEQGKMKVMRQSAEKRLIFRD